MARPQARTPTLAILQRLASLVMLVVCGCGSDIPGPKFPEADELDRIAATFVESKGNTVGGDRLPLWTLAEPLPTRIGQGPALGDSHGERLLRELAAIEPRLRVDEPLTCAAHQLAEFQARRDAMPTQALVRFMLHRCGATTPRFRWVTATLGAPPRLEDARDLVARHHYAGGPLGLWALERGARWLLVGVVAEPSVAIAPLSMDASAGQVVIEGEVSKRDWLVAHVTQGEAGFDTCHVALLGGGRFHATCPVDRGDAGATIDISAAPPGRLLGQLEARLWVSPDGSLGASFEDPTRGAPPTPIRATLEQDFVAAVNELRAAAGSKPLTIHEDQSRVIARLRPHYRDAAARGDGRLLDDIALGLLAGWAITDPILSGSFSALEFETLGGREHLLEAALSQAWLRAALLDPTLSRIAIAIDPGKASEILGGMFATYTLAEPGPRETERLELGQRIVHARASRSLPAIAPLPGANKELAEAGASVAQRGGGAQAALTDALTRIQAAHPGAAIGGYLAFTQDIHQMPVPEELLDPRITHAALHVELVQGADQPWATLMILFAYVSS